MPKVSPAHEQKRRDQILAAAMTCFARNGYRATSVEDIVQESGLSVGALYTYFASKEDMFLSLAQKRQEETIAYMRDLFQSPGPMAGKMTAAIDYFFEQLVEEAEPLARVSFEFWGEASKSERLQAHHAERCESIRQFLVWLLSEAQRKGDVRPDVDVHAAAELLLALNDGILMHHVARQRPVKTEALKAAYVTLLNQGLATPAHPFFAQPADDSANGGSHADSQPAIAESTLVARKAS